MDSNKLKKITDLLRYGDGKFLVVEDGKPAFVVMDIEQFKGMKCEEEDKNFDPEEFMRNFGWDGDERNYIDRCRAFDGNEFGEEDDFDRFEENYNSEEDDEEGFSPDDIPFEDFLKEQDNIEKGQDIGKNKDEIVIEPIPNSVSSEKLPQEEKKEEKPAVNLSDIPF